MPNFLYAKVGNMINEQKGGIAFQVFDSKISKFLSRSYYSEQNLFCSGSLQAICERLDIDYKNLYKTIQSYNDSCIENAVIDFSCLDYCGAVDCFGIKKSNWAQRIDKPPYFIAPVRTGLTFTYGGLKIDVDARVCMTDGNCVKNLFACGEIVGGIHYGNYAGGTGLMLGSVFGKIAGENA